MKKKTLFDHINQITKNSDSNYYDNLSDEDKKTYSVYMVHRFLSMNEDWIENVNEIQKYSQQLKQSGTHKVYNEIIPKSKTYLKYVKSTNTKKYNKAILDILTKYYELGEAQVKQYYDIFTKSEESKKLLLNIVKLYGIQSGEYTKLEKDLNAS